MVKRGRGMFIDPEPDEPSFVWFGKIFQSRMVRPELRSAVGTVDQMNCFFPDEALLNLCRSFLSTMLEISTESMDVNYIAISVELAVSSVGRESTARVRYIERLIEDDPELMTILELCR